MTWAISVCGVLLCAASSAGAGYTIVGWNNLGMHCMDAEFSTLSLLPPYNTIHAQVIDPSGAAVTDPVAVGITVTYEAVADATRSINTTSQGRRTSGSTCWRSSAPAHPPTSGSRASGCRAPATRRSR
jgi:hypothetical protein